MLRPQLVRDEQGKLFIQVRYNKFTATCPLPDNIESMDDDAAKEFIAKVVPQMVEGLHQMQRDQDRKLRRNKC